MSAEKKILYFSEEFIWLKERSEQSSFTLICAPSGYGKTIALRSMVNSFKGKVFRMNLHGSRPQDFFEEFCQTVLKGNCSAMAISAFIQNGLPKTKEDVDKFLECIKEVCAEKQCLIAIDDYSEMGNPEYIEFLYECTNQLKGELHIVVSARHFDTTGIKEQITKGEVIYISKEDLRLKEKDIQAYFLANDVEISPDEAADIYRQSEGWFAKLYVMLRHYRMNGKVEGYDARSLSDMIKHNRYLLLPGECKRFLNRVFPTKTFTRECGIFLAGGGENAELLLDYTVDKAGFIFYDSNRQVYRSHPLYRKIIKEAFSNLAIDEQNAIYKRYEAWRSEHFIDVANPDLLKVFNEGSPKELEDKVEALGIENRLDKEQLKQMLKIFRKRQIESSHKD